LDIEGIENVMIYVSDSLRWDYTPKSIMNMGVCVKTVAASLYTASSFPSIFSGLYPINHRVYTWKDLLSPKFYGLLSLENVHSSLWCETTWTHYPPNDSEIHRICGNPQGIPLDKIETPFIFIEDDKGGHCPYGISFTDADAPSCADFFLSEQSFTDEGYLQNQYKKGIEISRDNFLKRLKTLQDRGLLSSTLIIFTSDHGELLGEYGGIVSHGKPACPELVYVPTVFIHPSLETKLVPNEIISHVDLYPTILNILNQAMKYLPDGRNLLVDDNQSYRYNYYFERPPETSKYRTLLRYQEQSIWDVNGGFVFHDSSFLKTVILPLYYYISSYRLYMTFAKKYRMKYEKNIRKKYKKLFNRHSFSSVIRYGEPSCSLEEARSLIDSVEPAPNSESFEERSIDEDSMRKLEGLGYF
jgi:hypothetical protein